VLGAFVVSYREAYDVAVSCQAFPDGSMMASVVKSPERYAAPFARQRDRMAQSRPSVGRRDGAAGADAADNLRRSLASTRRGIKAYVRYHDLRRLLTFTNGGENGGWRTRSEALQSFSDWYRKDGRRLLGDTPYLAVAERGGAGGRWHLHVVVQPGGWLKYRSIHASWSNHLNAEGYISPTGAHRWHAGDERGRGKRAFSSARTAAAYICKYLTKSLEADGIERYRHRYRHGGGRSPQPMRFRVRTLRDGLAALGLHEGMAGLYPLTHTTDEGETHTFGYLYDGP